MKAYDPEWGESGVRPLKECVERNSLCKILPTYSSNPPTIPSCMRKGSLPANVSMPGVDACRCSKCGGVIRASWGVPIEGIGGVLAALCTRPFEKEVMLGECCAESVGVCARCCW